MFLMEIKGIVAAMVTPMFADGSINEAELRNQVNRQIAAGVDGIFTLGTNGEFYIMSMEEKKRVMQIVVDEAKKRVPIYAGAGCVSTADTVELSQAAQEMGVDALSLVTPYFAALNQSELYEHFSSVSKSVDVPIVLYNIPARAGVSIDYTTVAKLANNCSNIKGVKDSSGNFDNILRYIEATDSENFSVLSGNDSLILWTLMAGGKGGITAVANVLPEVMVSIYQNYIKGDIAAAKTAQDSIRAIRDCFKYGNPNSIIKAATNIIGQPVGPCRKPFGLISDEAIKGITETIDKCYPQHKK
ncbi:MAG: 4-hydroxy-tetrahydrodipicolinate synthase [Lachnospiraceae bacterium]|nr:4-hydroxy-tetrahydrodipicolinate synthase [Lachnospiraceae bacterium]